MSVDENGWKQFKIVKKRFQSVENYKNSWKRSKTVKTVKNSWHWVSEFLSFQGCKCPSYQVTKFPSSNSLFPGKLADRRRPLKKIACKGTTHRQQKNIATLTLNRPSVTIQWKLDRVGPVDNRPSVDKVPALKKNTKDTWHLTLDNWHRTCDTWWGANILLKFQLPSSYGFEGFEERGRWLNELINQWVTKVIVEQPRLHQGLLIMISCFWNKYVLTVIQTDWWWKNLSDIKSGSGVSILGQCRIISFFIRPPTFIKMSDRCRPISWHIQLSPIKSYGTSGTPPPSYSGFLQLYACLDKTI